MCRAAFEKEVVGGGFDALRSAVAEHGSWLRANCANQVWGGAGQGGAVWAWGRRE